MMIGSSSRTDPAAHAIEHLEPGHLRHADVEHDQVEALRFQEVERRLAAGGGRDGIARLTQLLSELSPVRQYRHPRKGYARCSTRDPHRRLSGHDPNNPKPLRSLASYTRFIPSP